jgi:hypothetical protein
VAPEGYEWRHEQLVSHGELTRWDPKHGESFPAERFRCLVLVRSQRGEGWGSIADGRLPLPTDLGGPELPFRRAVDAYLATHGGTKKACFEADRGDHRQLAGNARAALLATRRPRLAVRRTALVISSA